MSKPISIIGHGLSGTVLALTFFRKNIPFQLFGTPMPGEASIASSGIIAPITGRRYVKAWDIDQYIASALDFYRWTESLFEKSFFHEIEIVRFLTNEEALSAWEKRLQEEDYRKFISNKKYPVLDKLEKPYGIVTGGYQLNTNSWLQEAHLFLQQHNLLSIIDHPVSVDELSGSKIILATGAVDQRYKHGIIPNKGEALIVRMPEWKIPLIVKEEVFIVPIENEHYWVGSYYERWPETPGPSESGKNQLLEAISRFYSGPMEIIDHVAGIRPTVDDRRPLIGSYPGYNDVFLFNGMGTKATSLAPYWSSALMTHVLEGLSLPKEVSPARYSI